MSAGQSLSMLHAVPTAVAVLGQPGGALALAVTNGSISGACATSTRALTALAAHAASPREVRPTSCSVLETVANTGPPLSAEHVSPGDGVASKLAARTASSIIVASRLVPGS